MDNTLSVKPMTRTLAAEFIRNEFLNSIKSLGGQVEAMDQLASKTNDPILRSLFKQLGRSGRNVFLLKRIGLINVHVRSEPPGWWNILMTVKEDFDLLKRELRVKGYYVLLIGRGDQYVANGYIVTDFNSTPFVTHPGVEATKYSINEKQHLDPTGVLLSVERIAKELLHLGKAL